MVLTKLAEYFPIVKDPETPLTFHDRLKHTFIVLLLFFTLSSIPIVGVSPEISARLRELAWILGSNFGTLTTLGIGPIVMAGILLQVLVGGKILPIDLSTKEGRVLFNDYNRAFILIFILLESFAVLATGALKPDFTLGISPMFLYILIYIQVALGALFIVILDDYCLKYGITSGVNLFILASISKALVMRLFNPFPRHFGEAPYGLLFQGISSFLSGNLQQAMLAFSVIIVTFIVLIVAAYLQNAKVEVPITLMRVGGRVMRYPINLLYTSVIPIIILYAFILQTEMIYMHLTGTKQYVFVRPNLIEHIITQGWSYILNPFNWLYIVFYALVWITGAAIISYMWVYSTGMDPKTLAQQLTSFPIARFRDPRIVERTLERYIKPISILSGVLIGSLVALADILGSALAGTSLLLLIVVAYSIYEDMARNNVLHLLPIIGKYLK